MINSYGVRFCDRCGVVLDKKNNKCGFELCDKCNQELEKADKSRKDKEDT